MPKKVQPTKIVNDKGKLAHEIVWLDIDDVADAWWNPNRETAEKFNALFESIQDLGFVDVIQVIPLDAQALAVFTEQSDQDRLRTFIQQGKKFLAVHGQHRLEAARLLGKENLSQVPGVVLRPDSAEKVKALSVRLNVIRGEIDPARFTDLYQELAQTSGAQYSELWDMLGIVNKREFDSLYKEVEVQNDFLEAEFKSVQQELENVEAIRTLLHDLIRRYGKDLPYQFMSFMIGSRQKAQVHTYVKLSRKTADLLARVKEYCRQHEVDINDVLEYGWKAAMGPEQDWPEPRTSDLGMEE